MLWPHEPNFTLSALQAETADGRDLLCFLPAKFNKKLWIKRGGFIVVEEGDKDTDDKVTATIVKVLYEQDVKALKKLAGVWYAALGTCHACYPPKHPYCISNIRA